MELSEYFKKKLPREAKGRYIQKLNQCGLKRDPYGIPSSDWDYTPSEIPAVRQCDLSMYMIHTPSPYTLAETKVIITSLHYYVIFSLFFFKMRQIMKSPIVMIKSYLFV